ncbi:FG-GAP-like repeat-containing protein, partial [candidate division KSB1 bacterium]
MTDSSSGQGLAWGDYDNDGNLDLYISNLGVNHPNRLYHNNGDGTFSEVGGPAGVNDTGTGLGSAWGDYDGDGDLDLYLANGSSYNRLFRNNGDGGFTEVGETAGVRDFDPGRGVAWADYDSDGDLDLYVANESFANWLYQNNGDGTFTNMAQTAGVDDNGAGYGTAWADYDADGDPDIYVVRPSAANLLYRNNGDGTFTDVAGTAGVADIGNGRGVAWADYDNDGYLDLYLSEAGNPNRLYHNNGNGTFGDKSSLAGVNDSGSSWGVAWGDFDADGYIDLYVTNNNSPNRLYKNNGDATFTDVAETMGVDHSGAGFSAAWADYDRDGDLDLYLVNYATQANCLYRNEGTSNNWIAFKLVGQPLNTAAIGASVRLISGGLSQVRTVSGGSGYLSQDMADIYFGLGSNTSIDSIVIGWPSGSEQALTGFAIDQYHTVAEANTLPPGTPTGLNATVSGSQIDLSWSANSEGDLARYIVYRDVTSGFTPTAGDSIGGMNQPTTTFSDTGPSPGITYYYKVAAVDTAGNVSAASSEDSANLPMFTDIASAAGVAVSGSSFGVAWGDFDGDGDQDLCVSDQTGDDKLFRNNGDGTFTDITAAAGIDPSVDGSGPAWADFDNDNDPDLYLSFYGLYRNDSDGTFTNVSPEFSMAGVQGAWADYNNDGYVDLYGTSPNINRLHKNNGDGTFTDVADSAGVNDDSASRPAAWGDYDNDGDLDLYVGNNGANKLYRNEGNGTFTDVTASAGTGLGDTGEAQGVGWADYDNDGDLDLYVSNFLSDNKLFKNDGDGTFTNATSSAGVVDTGIGGFAWGDYDNDGGLDLFVTTNTGVSRLYHNNHDGTFTDEAATQGMGITTFTRGVAWGDYDRDGDLDLYIANTATNILYKNNESGNHWIVLNLRGVDSNRSAIGTSVRVKTDPDNQLRQVSGGSGWASQDMLPVHFGLGSGASIDSVIIRWPTGAEQVLTGLAVDQYLEITEPAADPPPAAPTGLVAVAEDGAASVAWSPNSESDLSHYIVYQDTTQGFTPSSADSVGRVDKPDTSFTTMILINYITYYFRVAAVDSSGNQSAASGEVSAMPVDLSPPAITVGPTVEDSSTTTCTIVWTTDEPATSIVECGLTTSYDITAEDTAKTTVHSVGLTDLLPGATYHYRVGSADIAGNGPAWSNDFIFHTLAGDSIAPVIVLGPSVTGRTDTLAIISWVTNESTDGYVEFGSDPDYGQMAGSDEYTEL